MDSPIAPIDLTKITTYSVKDRKSKVNARDFSKPWIAGGSFSQFLSTLPAILAGNDLIEVIQAISQAKINNAPICLAMGAHVIKVGLNPILIDLMERGLMSMLSMNGAGIIHDLEVALTGKTSEDVAASIGDGGFGMAAETSILLSRAIKEAADQGKGLGQAVGDFINNERMPFKDKSLTATCARLGIPVTVHVAMGTDIIHMHPDFDPAACGAASHLDFRIFAAMVATLEKGVFINAGSAVILPEVFLKALTVARNLGYRPQNFTTVNLDFIRHYRPMTNVVNRPTLKGGKGYSIVGHHELLIPLIAAGVIENLGT
ncbi:conserved hypothetical protein [Desulforapulum autotrophicum HRM2]|uniref:Uncharacterized protein n=1 Tax=Desulforapulum autotrophicum (strain ATCC 43914 / DSM 3382 / VKM B-1955 / HRM2) TaxID=177437 RepID=C0Q9U0_DESAH|nr:hypothetical protein [Desulforapulum autotrophicum]ACN16658.1 conserved hypothetical protein [Desulforapulum autotrophicum HRM2]